LRNSVTNADESVGDWTSISDANRARITSARTSSADGQGKKRRTSSRSLEKWVGPMCASVKKLLEDAGAGISDPVVQNQEDDLIRAGDEVAASNGHKGAKRLKQPHRLSTSSSILDRGFSAGGRLYCQSPEEKPRIRNHYLLMPRFAQRGRTGIRGARRPDQQAF
jgi:hypothetical protein